MKDSIGLIEVVGLSAAVQVADVMVKTANIRLVGIENTKGLGYMTIKAAGDIGAITAAVTDGVQSAKMSGKYVTSKVIPRPSEGILLQFCQEPANESGCFTEPEQETVLVSRALEIQKTEEPAVDPELEELASEEDLGIINPPAHTEAEDKK